MRKIKLRVESLAVESFRTGGGVRAPGTVRGHGDDCTWVASCLCRTNYYQCGTGPATIYSCTYTADERCTRDTSPEQCGVSFMEYCPLETDGC